MQNIKIKIILNVVIIILSIFTAKAQEDTSDFSTWSSIGVEYKLNKKWTFGLQEQLRLKTNSSVVDEYFTQLEAERKIFKNFKLGAAFRYIRDNDNQGNIQGYENHIRFHLDAKYKHKISKLSLGYRIRYQNKNELGFTNEDGDFANQNIRFKTAFEYNFSKWPLDPKFSAEIFNRFQEESNNNGFNKYRLTFGTDYKIKNFGKIKLFYRFEKELNTNLPETTNIVGLNYTYTFKNN